MDDVWTATEFHLNLSRQSICFAFSDLDRN